MSGPLNKEEALQPPRRRRSVPVTIRRTRTGSRTVGARRTNSIVVGGDRREYGNNNNNDGNLDLDVNNIPRTAREPNNRRHSPFRGEGSYRNANNTMSSPDHNLRRSADHIHRSNNNSVNTSGTINNFAPLSVGASLSSNATNPSAGASGGNNYLTAKGHPSAVSLLPQRYNQQRKLSGGNNMGTEGGGGEQQQQQLVRVKVYKDGENYAKVLMINRNIEYEELERVILNRWEISPSDRPSLYYKDDEQDSIKLDAGELHRLLRNSNSVTDIVKIHINVKNNGNTSNRNDTAANGSQRPKRRQGTEPSYRRQDSDKVNLTSPKMQNSDNKKVTRRASVPVAGEDSSVNKSLYSVPVVHPRGSLGSTAEDDAAAAAANANQGESTIEILRRNKWGGGLDAGKLPPRSGTRAQDPWQVTLEAMERDKLPWRKLGVIGKGAYGVVYEGVLDNGKHVAVKVLDVPQHVSSSIDESNNSGPGQSVRKLIREINLMRRLEHPNIVAYIHCHITRLDDPNIHRAGGHGSLMTTPRANVQPLQVEIVMELCSKGPLSQIVKQSPRGTLSVKEARKYIKQILQGLMYLHSRGVIHRDIKGDNVLISEEGVAKLADFGCSRRIADATQTLDTPMNSQLFSCSSNRRAPVRRSGDTSASEKALNMMDSLYMGTMGGVAHTMVGTPLFMAPEVIVQEAMPFGDEGSNNNVGTSTFGISNTMVSDDVNLGSIASSAKRSPAKASGAANAGKKDSNNTSSASTTGGYAAPADIWAVGCLLLELFGRSPWPVRGNYIQVLFQIANAPMDRLPPGVPENCQPCLAEFFSKCLQRDPKKRATARELLRTEWITCDEDKLESPPRTGRR